MKDHTAAEEHYRKLAEAVAKGKEEEKDPEDATGIYLLLLKLCRELGNRAMSPLRLARIAYDAERFHHPTLGNSAGRGPKADDIDPGIYIFRQRLERASKEETGLWPDGPLFWELVDILRAVDQGDRRSLVKRNEKLKSLDLKADDLNALLAKVGAKEEKEGDDGDDKHHFTFKDPEPCPDPVDGAELLDEIADKIRAHVLLQEGDYRKAALYVAFTWTIDAFGVAPRLLLWSPEAGAGKTTLMTVLAAMVRRPVPSSNLSTSALFRAIDAWGPTLLMDEFDRVDVEKKRELLSVLNSGHTRSMAFLLRSEPTGSGETWEPRRYSTWAAIVFARIGRRGDVAADSRCITIKLDRATREEAGKLKRFREDRLSDDLADLQRKMARWAADNHGLLRDEDPRMPEALYNRGADLWRPLVAIADLAGGDWPEGTRSIAVQAVASPDDPSYRTLALEDCRTVFDTRGEKRIPSKELVAAMRDLEDRPWGTWGKTEKGLNSHGLSGILGNFGIGTKDAKNSEGKNLKHYFRADFEKPWKQYRPPTPPSGNATSLQSPIEAESAAESTNDGDEETLPAGGRARFLFPDPGTSSSCIGQSSGVADRKGGVEGKDKIAPPGGQESEARWGDSPQEPDPEPEGIRRVVPTEVEGEL